MKLRVTVVAALAFCTAATAFQQRTFAQNRGGRFRPVSTANGTQPSEVYAEPVPSANMGGQPHGGYSPGGYSGPEYSSGQVYGDGYATSGPYCNTDCDWEAGCSDTCGYDCGDSCYPCDVGMFGCPRGQWFFTADYLYVRSNFSESVSYLEQVDDVQQGVGTDTFHSLDFQYDSSYRFGGGYRLCNCGDEIRFMYTRLSSYADDVAPFGSFLPYEVTAEPDGQTLIHAGISAKSYDVEFAKTIPLGGRMGCSDPCGCGDACDCGPACPSWDVTWTGGFRFADVSWERDYNAVNSDSVTTTHATSALDFRGGGLKVGLEGRRYFCKNGCFSVYLKGDISLLLGDIETAARRVTDDPTTQPEIDTLNTQTASFRNIIPVTEIETGLTGHLTRNISMTSGYLFSAWHDLGLRDEFTFPTLMETRYDDGNILGFDGFFARLEVAY